MRRADVEKKLYEAFIEKWDEFMKGQTVGKYKDGAIDYYDHDVERFLALYLEDVPTFFD